MPLPLRNSSILGLQMSTSSSHGLRCLLCGVEMKLLLSTTEQHYNKYFWKCTRKYGGVGCKGFVLCNDVDNTKWRENIIFKDSQRMENNGSKGVVFQSM
ncbi:hypothetical protein L3X38_032532 [Prunus dulcis]|uniref:Uncharacterized protein n=1 Tax=Prunus dulcis TaxID=3755 RepID=A0AAD4VE98_PRUDU|nr:hypothetical protein L3X38_032532 [Prunus dulcis]